MPKNKRVVYGEEDLDLAGALLDHENDPTSTDREAVEVQKRIRKRSRGQKSELAASVEDSGGGGGSNSSSSSSAARGDVVVPASAAALVNDRTVYIEGLPFTATEQEVRDFFVSVKSGVILSVRLPRWHDSGNLRGYGHVEFQNAAAATEAMKLDGAHMQKRFIKVDRPMTPRLLQQQHEQQLHPTKIARPAGCRTIFVKNIPYDTNEEEITDVFKVCGVVQNVRIPVWGHTNQLKGIAYITFKKEESAEIAVKKGLQVRGRPVFVDFEIGEAKGSFRGPVVSDKKRGKR